jgi:hypothetical protein
MNYVIFSSPLSLAVIAGIFVLYVLLAVSRFVFKKPSLTAVLGIINIVAHVALIAVCLIISATLAEIFFLLVTSAAIALAVSKPQKEDADDEL